MGLRTALTLIFLASAGVSAGEVYRYVDKDGVVHYTDRPPSPQSEPIKLPPVQLIGATPARTSTPPAEDASKAEAKIGMSIVSPTADETFRGDDHRLPVSLRLDSPLPPGFGLFFLLDGSAQNAEPSTSLSYTLQNVERGSHLVSARAVDAGGREVGRADPVIVHMKPPTVDQAPRMPRPAPSR